MHANEPSGRHLCCSPWCSQEGRSTKDTAAHQTNGLHVKWHHLSLCVLDNKLAQIRGIRHVLVQNRGLRISKQSRLYQSKQMGNVREDVHANGNAESCQLEASLLEGLSLLSLHFSHLMANQEDISLFRSPTFFLSPSRCHRHPHLHAHPTKQWYLAKV